MGYGSSSTSVTNTPAPQTPEQREADRLRLLEMQRQNTIAEQMLPGQLALIEQQRQILQYQIDHQDDLDEIHNSQLELAKLQIQQQISDAAMQQQLQPLQLQFLQNQNQLAIEQMSMMKETMGFQKEQNKYILESLQDQSRRLAARNAAYSPEEEAKAAAEEARRASRMGALSEQAAKIQLENLKRGTKPTEEQLANINEAYDAAQKSGESDINRFLVQTQRTIQEEIAQASGLRPTDAPMVRLSERAGEEAARAQGDLTTSIEGQRATARLNYPLAASQMAGNQAATLQGLTANAANFQSELRLAANANRQQAFSLPGSIGFATPQAGPSPNLGFMNSGAGGYNPGAFGMNIGVPQGGTQTTTNHPGAMEWVNTIGNLASGTGRAMQAWQTSDVRLKTDIKKVGHLQSGLPIYVYRYKGDATPRLGVMAQEARRLFPDAVKETPSGYLAVRYDKVR
jgi:hypothetical protein